MKKLMIVAAAAAMVGVAEATTVKYDFVANLQTTVGQPGVDAYAPGAVNLGVDGVNTMWYDDAATLAPLVTKAGNVYTWNAPATYPNLRWTIGRSMGGLPHPTLTIVPTVINGQNVNILNAAEDTLLTTLAATYNLPSFGVWCCQLSWYQRTPAQCYRVPGADAIFQEIRLVRQNCCTAPTRCFTLANGTVAISYLGTPIAGGDACLFNRFGAQTADQAAYVETFARVQNFTTLNAGLLFTGWLAGQGYQQTFACRDVPAVTVNAPAQISGTIVGYTAAPVCPDCCIRPLPQAIAFECLDTAVATTPATAAYGTYYIQIKDITNAD